jgi:hypothetical protein
MTEELRRPITSTRSGREDAGDSLEKKLVGSSPVETSLRGTNDQEKHSVFSNICFGGSHE